MVWFFHQKPLWELIPQNKILLVCNKCLIIWLSIPMYNVQKKWIIIQRNRWNIISRTNSHTNFQISFFFVCVCVCSSFIQFSMYGEIVDSKKSKMLIIAALHEKSHQFMVGGFDVDLWRFVVFISPRLCTIFALYYYQPSGSKTKQKKTTLWKEMKT